ncbi:MAG: flagellar filament capping protein FliD [Gallionella sp.]|nr:flagellar filament capping protein FliD [Gallionella sp.]
MATQATTSTTNLDVNNIVSQLMTVERQPINKLNAKEASYQAQLSAYGSIKGAVSSFQASLQGLNNVSKFQALKATPSDTSIFTASAISTAVAGSYSVEVSSLAKAQSLISEGQATSDTAIGAGGTTTISFDFGTIGGGAFTPYDAETGTGGTYAGVTGFTGNGGDTKSITIDSENNTLEGIRDAINAAKMGISATIVNDGSDTPYRLALTSSSLGKTNSMKITVAGDADIGNLLAHDPQGTQNLAETVTASNANLKVNGVAVSKTSNSVSDVIQGVTLALNKITAADTPVTLTVARDTSTLSTSLSSFVKSYNDLAGTLKTLSAYDPASKKGAILQGDSTVRTFQNQLRSMLGATAGEASNTLRTLSDVGIAFQLDGTLAINQARLDSAINNNFDEIAALFTGTNGYVNTLKSWATSALGADGMLAGRTEGIGKTITDLGRRRSAIETRLISVEARYRAQFTALDSMLSSMNQTSTYLSQQLSNLP